MRDWVDKQPSDETVTESKSLQPAAFVAIEMIADESGGLSESALALAALRLDATTKTMAGAHDSSQGGQRPGAGYAPTGPLLFIWLTTDG